MATIVVCLTIIPRVRVGYEMADRQRGAYRRVGYNHLISNKREWNNCFIKLKTPTRYRQFFPTLFVNKKKNKNDFQLVFNYEQTRTVTILESIIVHIKGG